MTTNILIDGKWYLLLFRKMAKFLVEESMYNLYFASYESPLQKVTTKNFKELDKKVKSYEDIRTSGDCFLLELEIPALDIEFCTDSSNVKVRSKYWKNNSLLPKVDKDLFDYWHKK